MNIFPFVIMPLGQFPETLNEFFKNNFSQLNWCFAGESGHRVPYCVNLEDWSSIVYFVEQIPPDFTLRSHQPFLVVG